MSTGNGRQGTTSLPVIQIPGFAVSWAGTSPWGPSHCFGSEDGRVLLTDPGNPEEPREGGGPFEVSPSGEAVNGIAFAGSAMAVSTRAEVTVVLDIRPSARRASRVRIPHGAHGVVATASGIFLAPSGTQGILRFDPRRPQEVTRDWSPGDSWYAYRLALVGTASGGEFACCVARRGGFFAWSVEPDRGPACARRLRGTGVDFVDVTPLGSETHPFAAAALGADGSLHFMRDVAHEPSVKTLRFTSSGERAYRLLSSEGHVFLLTDRRLLCYPSLARRFLEQSDIGGPERCQALEIEAVDIALGLDRSLLVVVADGFCRIPIDSLTEDDSLLANVTGADHRAGEIHPFEPSPSWQSSSAFQLEAVG